MFSGQACDCFFSYGLAFFNHLLSQNNSGSLYLSNFAGQTVRLQLCLANPEQSSKIPKMLRTLEATVQITAQGNFVCKRELADRPHAVSVRCQISTVLVRDLLHKGSPSLMKHTQISGDVALASALAKLLSSLHWDFEEDLSQCVGDVAAYQASLVLKNMKKTAFSMADRIRSQLKNCCSYNN